MILEAPLAALVSYAFGCVCVRHYLTQWRSGVVSRIPGRGRAMLAFALDIGIGFMAVRLAWVFSSDPVIPAVAVIAVAAGNIWPVQLAFQGGRGIAAAAGAFLAFDPVLAVAVLLVGLFIFAFIPRLVILGAIMGVVAPFLSFYMGRPPASAWTWIALMAIVLAAHLRGTTRRKFSRKPPRRPMHEAAKKPAMGFLRKPPVRRRRS